MEAEKYVKSIIKNVKCSGSKRKEIQKQLLSDIEAAIENGESLNTVLENIGTVDEVAEEFNQNLTEAELKKYQNGKRAKIITIIVVIIALFVLAIMWMLPKNKSLDDSSIFDKIEVEKQVQTVVELLDNDDFESLKAMSVDKMKDVMTQDTIESARAQMGGEWGNRVSFGNMYAVEMEQQGTILAVCQVNVAYENKSVTYTISFDENMKLAGLYMK